jgi:hypothetical protein
MGEFDLDTLVLDVVRKQTAQPSAGAGSRFQKDLGLSENGRKTLFAFVVEAFTARGLNLPARGFYLSHFLACQTPGDVQSAIREALTGAKRKAAAAAVKPPAPATPAPVRPAAATPAAIGTVDVSKQKAKPTPPAPAKSKSKTKAAVVKKKAQTRKAPTRRRAA